MQAIRTLSRRHVAAPMLRLARIARSRMRNGGAAYAAHLHAEKRNFAACETVHDLPAIFHSFIDRVHAADEEALAQGVVEPTRMFAACAHRPRVRLVI